jgi:hypothetical protein
LAIALFTALSRSGETFAVPFMTLETVARLTPAVFATKSMVTSGPFLLTVARVVMIKEV